MAAANEHGLKIFHSDVAQACVHAKLGSEIYMKLPDGCCDMSGDMFRLNRYMQLPDVCGDMSGKIVRLNRSLYGQKKSRRQCAE